MQLQGYALGMTMYMHDLPQCSQQLCSVSAASTWAATRRDKAMGLTPMCLT